VEALANVARPDRARPDTELRLALAMRGGVSLAVWIGGAVAEIDLLRRSTPDRRVDGRGDVYRQLLAAAGYTTVAVDVLVGASAGGLNASIYAASQVYGFDFDAMAAVWVRLGDLGALLRRPDSAAEDGTPPSLLLGDGYFLREFEAQLGALLPPAATADGAAAPDRTAVPRLELFLAATLLEPTIRRFGNDRFSTVLETRQDAYFHFRHRRGVEWPLSDFATGDGRGRTVAALALAGRASSSFPGAFEPATIVSTPTASPDTPVGNLFGIFSEQAPATGPRARPFPVIDGGVLDNIPVGRAIQAIAAAPAADRTERRLLYLHPSPPNLETQAVARPRNMARALTTVQAALKAKLDRESLIEDMLELNRHNGLVNERREVRRALVTGATGPDGALVVDADLRAGAIVARAALDDQRVREILADPDQAIAGHPVTTASPGPLLRRWVPAATTALDADLLALLQRSVDDGVVQRGLPALVTVTELALDWARTLERAGAPVGPVKAALYRLRFVLELLGAAWDRVWMLAAARTELTDPAGLPDWVTARVAHATRVSEVLPAAHAEALRTALLTGIAAPGRDGEPAAEPVDEAEFHRRVRALHEDLVGLAEPDAPLPPAPDPAAVPFLWSVLVRALAALAGQPIADDRFDDPAHRQLLRAGRAAAGPGDAAGADVLYGLSVVLAPLHDRVARSESSIRFLRVSGDARSPLAGWFHPPAVTPEAKLAGNQVANFGAFFSARWRANDWMWGRLDSAKTLVDLLVDHRRWHELEDADLPHDARARAQLARVEAIVRTPLAGGGPEWDAWLDDLWSRARGPVDAELRSANATPDLTHALTETKDVLTARLHAELLATHLPWVEAVDPGAMPGEVPAPGPPRDPSATRDLAGAHRAGAETVPHDLDPRRFASLAMTGALVGWRAFRPSAWWKAGIMAVLKPFYVFLAAAAVATRRTLLPAILGFAALAVGRWEGQRPIWDGDFAARDVCGPCRYWIWPRILCLVAVVVLVLVLAVREVLTPRRWRWWPVRLAAAGAVLAGVLVALALEASLAPWIIVPTAAVVVLVAGSWMAPRWQVVALAIDLGIYVGLGIMFDDLGWAPGWWAFSSFVVAALALTSLLTVADAMPRPAPAAPTADPAAPTASRS
jgi:patatin-related protein